MGLPWKSFQTFCGAFIQQGRLDRDLLYQLRAALVRRNPHVPKEAADEQALAYFTDSAWEKVGGPSRTFMRLDWGQPERGHSGALLAGTRMDYAINPRPPAPSFAWGDHAF